MCKPQFTLHRVIPQRPHAIVIGSGFGGLAAAVRLGARGYRVTVLEKLDAPGGRAYVFRQDGFTFDGGPTIVTAPFLLEELWALCGRRLSDDVDLRPITPFYRIRFNDGEVFEYTGDADAMRAQVAAFSTRDVAGYEAFLRASQEIYRVGFEQLGDASFESWTDMARLVPQLVRLGSLRSVYQLVGKYVKDERLRTVLSFHPLLVGGNPFAASSIYSLICFLERRWGVHFAMGGTGALVSGLAGLIAGQGGTIRCDTEVAEILVENNAACGVRLADGDTLRADVVVSNACSAFTYSKLLPARHRRRWTDRRIARGRYSMSLFVWYFGTRRRYDDVAHHTILLGPRYRELLARYIQAAHACRRFQPVSAPADGDRYFSGAGRVRCVLCAVAGAASAERHRLGGCGGAVSAEDRARFVGQHIAWAGGRDRDVAPDDAAGFFRPAAVVSRGGVRAGADIDAERLVPPA